MALINNTANTIKKIGEAIITIGVIASITIMIILFIMSSQTYKFEELYITLGFSVLIIGVPLSCINGILIYGFGELIDKVCIIEKNMRIIENKCDINNDELPEI